LLAVKLRNHTVELDEPDAPSQRDGIAQFGFGNDLGFGIHSVEFRRRFDGEEGRADLDRDRPDSAKTRFRMRR
jgi:hypothetical protein